MAQGKAAVSREMDAMRFDERGLIPAVVQEAGTGEVLMVAYMNRESLEQTLADGRHVVLQPQPGAALAEGGDVRPRPAGR